MRIVHIPTLHPMVAETIPADNAGDTFTIDHIPGLPPVELRYGDLLLPGGTAIAEMLHKKTDHIPLRKAIAMVTRTLRNVGYSRKQIPGKLLAIRRLTKTKPPHDREFFRARNNRTRRFVEDFVGRLITAESTVHGTHNLVEGVRKNREGMGTLMLSNHGSEPDPVLCSILLDREYQRRGQAGDEPEATAAAEAREKLLAVPGHKVMLDQFRRGLAGSVHSLFTIAAKYRDDLTPEQKTIANAYVANVHTLLTALIANPNYLVLTFPEGGRTRNRQIGMQVSTLRAAYGKCILPTFIDTPEGFLELEHGMEMDTTPQRIDMFFGTPFSTHRNGTRSSAEQFVHTFRDNLSAVGAPVEDYSWGYMKRGKIRAGSKREPEFVSIDC